MMKYDDDDDDDDRKDSIHYRETKMDDFNLAGVILLRDINLSND